MKGVSERVALCDRLGEGSRLMQPEWNTENLLDETAKGDERALGLLMERFRKRLEHMVAQHLHPLVAARLEPADVVQDTLIEALRKLDGYLQKRSIPFYPWLHSIALERIAKAHRHHLHVRARAAGREAGWTETHPNGAGPSFSERLVSRDPSPSEQVLRHELGQRVRETLARLSEPDRQVLVQCYMEGLSQAEVAATLGITVEAVKLRLFRAVGRFRGLAPTNDVGRGPSRETE